MYHQTSSLPQKVTTILVTFCIVLGLLLPSAGAQAAPAAPAVAITVELTATDDAGTIQSVPTASVPNAYLVLSKRGGGDFDNNFILFDLSAIPANATIDAAQLVLYINAGAQALDVEVGRVDGAWDETTVTWNTQPAVTWGGPVATVNGIGDISWPVQPLVEAWQNGAVPNFGFVLHGIDGNGAAVLADSKEWGVDPKLVIRYNIPADEGPRPDLGDAPDSTNHVGIPNTAYPGVNGDFPTVWSNTPANQPAGPRHANQTGEGILGDYLSREAEADVGPDQDGANNILMGAADNANNDRGDDGWRNRTASLDPCAQTTLIVRVRKAANATLNRMFLNVWFDGTHDGDWNDIQRCANVDGRFNVPAYEWIVQDDVVDMTAIPAGGFADIAVNTEMVLNATPDKAHWMRFMLSEAPAVRPATGALADGRGPNPTSAQGSYRFGETEDVLERPQPPGESGSLAIEKRVIATHNPVEWLDTVTYEIRLRHNGGSQPIQVEIRDELPYPLVVYPTLDASGVHYITVESTTGGAAPLEAKLEVEPPVFPDPPQQVVRWRGSLDPNAEIKLTFLVRVLTLCAPGEQTQTIRNMAQARPQNGNVITSEVSFTAKCLGYDESNIDVEVGGPIFNQIDPTEWNHVPWPVTLHNNHPVSVTLGLFQPQVSRTVGASAATQPRFLDKITVAPGETRLVDLTLRMDRDYTDELALPDDYTAAAKLVFCLLPDEGNTCPNVQKYPHLWGEMPWTPFTPRPNDLGDAPDSTNHGGVAMAAYPGRPANFPTVFDPATGLPEGPRHAFPRPFHFGKRVSLEAEADIGPDQDPTNNILPAANVANRDRFDDGVRPDLWNLANCQTTTVPVQVFISPQAVNWFHQLNRPGYLNLWLDSNRDGDWDDGITCQDPQGQNHGSVEHIVIDFPVDVVGLGAGLHLINVPTGYVPWPAALAQQPVWVRATLSERESNKTLQFGAIKYGDGRGYPTPFHTGETEDYLAHPAGSGGGPDLAVQLAGHVERRTVQPEAAAAQAESLLSSPLGIFKLEIENDGSAVARNARLQFQVPQALRGMESVLVRANGDVAIDTDQLRAQLKTGTVDLALPDLEPNSIIAVLIALAFPHAAPGQPIGSAAATANEITLSVAVNAPGDIDTSNNSATATIKPPLVAPVVAAVVGAGQALGTRETTCRSAANLSISGEPGQTVELLVDGTSNTILLMEHEAIFYLLQNLTPGKHRVQARYANAGVVDATAAGAQTGSGLRIDVDPSLPVDPMSLTFTDSQGRVIHPSTLDYSFRASQAGASLRSGETYQVGIDACGSNPNVSLAYELKNVMVSSLTDEDGDGRYTGSFTFDAAVTAADATADPILRLVVRSGATEQSLAITLQSSMDGIVRDAATGQPLPNTNVAALTARANVSDGATIAQGSTLNAGQTNPLATGADGRYSFAVAEGTYRLDVVSSGYQAYRSGDIAAIDGTLAQDLALTPALGEPATQTIYITPHGFEPALLVVPAGSVVEWVNVDLAEHTTAGNGSWDSGVLASGQGYKFKLQTTGSYDYVDATNPLNTATIIVNGGGQAATNAIYLPVIAR